MSKKNEKNIDIKGKLIYDNHNRYRVRKVMKKGVEKIMWMGITLGIVIGWCIIVSFIGWYEGKDDETPSVYWLTLNMWAMYILSVIIWG